MLFPVEQFNAFNEKYVSATLRLRLNQSAATFLR
jgi:hypothetical protein